MSFWEIEARVLATGKIRRVVVEAATDQLARVAMAESLEEQGVDGWIIEKVEGPRATRRAEEGPPRAREVKAPKTAKSVAESVLGVKRCKKAPARKARAGRPKVVAPYTADKVTSKLVDEKSKKFRVEFVLAPDGSWCLMLCHYRWSKIGWALATDVDFFDGGVGSGLLAWDVVPRSRVPASIRLAYEEAIVNWRALSDGRILDLKWHQKIAARRAKLKANLEDPRWVTRTAARAAKLQRRVTS